MLTYNQMVVGLLAGDTFSGAEADRVFHALSDSTRRDILARAIQREQSVSALARHYEISLTAVQKHVAVLERAALVSKQRSGREQLVAANPDTLRRANHLLRAFEQLWVAPREQDRGDPHGGRRITMTVISSSTNAEKLTLELVAEFDAPPDRVWEVWEDARKLERWWGPPTYPATFTRHEFEVGGESRYYMTGPDRRSPLRLVADRRARRSAAHRVRKRSCRR